MLGILTFGLENERAVKYNKGATVFDLHGGWLSSGSIWALQFEGTFITKVYQQSATVAIFSSAF